MVTRTSLANEIDEYDQQIADMNSGKKDCYDAYRAQLVESGFDKANIKAEIDAVKAAIKRRRAANKDFDALEEKDALIDEIFGEITAAPPAPRATRENIEQFDPETGEVLDRAARARRRTSESMDDNIAISAQMLADGLISEEAHASTISMSNAVARKFGDGPISPSVGSPPAAFTPMAALGTELSAAPNSPETATQSTAARKDVPLATAEDGRHLVGNEASQDEREEASHRPAGTQVLSADTISPEEAEEMSRYTTRGNGNSTVQVDPPTAHKPLRPLCLRPDQCGGYGDKTCHSCTVAARTTGEAA